MPIKTFKGKFVNGTQDTVVLHTNNGNTGYRIKKLQLMPGIPGDTFEMEAVVQIFSIKQTTIPTGGGGDKATVDLSNQALLAVAYYQDNVSVSGNSSLDIIVDNMTFNQDVYVTFTNNVAADASECNYYMELEQVKLDLNENTVATLKDIRNLS